MSYSFSGSLFDWHLFGRCVDANMVEIPVEVESPDHHYYHVCNTFIFVLACKHLFSWITSSWKYLLFWLFNGISNFVFGCAACFFHDQGCKGNGGINLGK